MSILEEVQREAEKLGSIEREVQEWVRQEKGFGETIDEEVNQWLEKAHNIGIKVSNSLIGVRAKSTLFSRLCQSQKHKEILKIKASMKDLVAQGRTFFPTEGIELVWRAGFADFRARRSSMARIIEGLKDDGVGIIGVSGLGGIGKTLLVTEIGKRAKDKKLFHQVLMATVSQNPDIRKVQGTLADMLDLEFERDDDEPGRANELRSRLDRETKKVLVILDDVWEVVNMDDIGIPAYSNKKGCKIIVTTRREKVCEDMCCDMAVRLDVINPEDAWNLFKKHVENDKMSSRIHTKARNIVKECGGLPLAIVVVGRALRGKDLEDYDDALRRLSKSDFVDVESADREIYTCLKLSYDYLKNEDAEKCFLLCSVFPDDSRIFVKELTRYAFGHCLFQDVDSIDEAKKRIFYSIKRLEDASLLSLAARVGNRKGDYFRTWPIVKMHDMVRDFALWIARGNDDYFFVLNSSENSKKVRAYKHATSLCLTKYELDWEFPNWSVCPNMKILIIKSNVSTSSFEDNQDIPDNFIEVTNTLQVLDLQTYNHKRSLPSIMLETLRNLGSFCLLEDMRSRTNYLSMIANLKNLEILELRCGRPQTSLPECVGELCNLRLLDLSNWYSLEMIPRNLLAKLSKLEELYTPYFHFPERRPRWNTSFLSDLNFLPCLTAFAGKFIGFQSLPDDFVFGNLRWYYINCRPFQLKNEEIRWTRCLGLDNVNELSMKMFEKLFPGVECLKIVGEDYLYGIQNIYPQIDNAGFQDLRELFLEGIYSLECLFDTTGSELGLPSLVTIFPKLVNLTLKNIVQLQKMCHGEPSTSYLPELKSVVIRDCQKLNNIVPNMLPIGSKLEELVIGECYMLKYVYDLMEDQLIQHTKHHLESLPHPKVIELYDLHQLQSIWKFPSQLEIMDAGLWRVIFRCLDSLVKAKILTCLELEDSYMDAGLCRVIVRCLDSLVKVKIHTCLELEEVFPLVELGSNQTADVHLSNLVELHLEYLPILKCIWKGDHHLCSLRNLERIKVAECGALTSIFSFTLSQSLQKLQHLVIHECRALKAIFIQEHQDGIIRRGQYSPNLVKGLQELKEISIKSCEKLNTVFPTCFLAHGLQNLESISVEDCAELEQLFGDHGEENVANGGPLHSDVSKELLSNLETLCLKLLPKLKCIWNGLQLNHGLENLNSIELEGCHTLTRLFTPTLVGGLDKLQYLLINNCQMLEMIVTRDDQDSAMMGVGSSSSGSRKYFQKIKTITIKSCDKLKIVLPIYVVAQGLPELESIFVENCAELEHVFGHLSEEHLAEGGKIRMYNLKDLTFLELPSLLLPLKFSISLSSQKEKEKEKKERISIMVDAEIDELKLFL